MVAMNSLRHKQIGEDDIHKLLLADYEIMG